MIQQNNASPILPPRKSEFLKAKTVIFDCDGVLLDSVSHKTRAFREWVKTNYPPFEWEFIKYHLASYGIGRTTQLKHFIKEILRMPVTKKTFQSMLHHLDERIGKHMKEVKLNPGVRELMSRCIKNKRKTFVVSGAPQGELEFHLKRLGIFDKFQGVYGAPISKEDGVRRIIKAYKINPKTAIFVGDATADAYAAHHFGIRFAYFPSEAKMESVHVWKKLKKMKDLASYV